MKLLCALGLLSLCFALISAQDNSTDTTATTPGPEVNATTENPVTPGNTTEQPTTTATTPIVTTSGPASGNLYYFQDGGVICILLQADISFNISYLKDDQTRGYMVYELPDYTSVTVGGSCDTNNQFMTIAFKPDDATEFTARFNFEENSSKERYARNLVLDYELTPALFPGVNGTGSRVATSPNGTYFEASESNQYVCKSNTTIKLNDDVDMMTYELNVQSFRTTNTTDFTGSRQQCPADAETNNIVPIAVGAALAGLVVIVLIAYLISRNRNKGGYESV